MRREPVRGASAAGAAGGIYFEPFELEQGSHTRITNMLRSMLDSSLSRWRPPAHGPVAGTLLTSASLHRTVDGLSTNGAPSRSIGVQASTEELAAAGAAARQERVVHALQVAGGSGGDAPSAGCRARDDNEPDCMRLQLSHLVLIVAVLDACQLLHFLRTGRIKI